MGQHAGTLITFEQSVGNSFAGVLVKLEQTIVLKNSFAGTLVTFEQSVQNSFAGTLVTFEQVIRNAVKPSNLQLYGWDARVIIGGLEIAHHLIHDVIDISLSENSAALMTMTLINKTGTIDLAEYHGKTITVDVETSKGITRAYTGTVDVPEFDLIRKLITLRCTDKRTEQINNQLQPQLKYIGYWSPAIFEEPDDVAGELTNRLLTTTKTVDFDAYGNYTIADFLPKATPDFVFNDAAIFRRNPTLQVASRGRLVNRVNLEFEFRYVRLRHRERSFKLNGPTFCDVMTTVGLAFLRVDGIKSNLDSFGWDVNPNSIQYEYLPPAGYYRCGPMGQKFIWSPISQSISTGVKKDKDGNAVKDGNGDDVIEVTGRNVIDYTKAFATSVQWTAAKQYAQDISQKINIQINAPQSQNQYGIIEKTQRNGLDVEFDSTEFEVNKGYQPAPAGFTKTATDDYQDQIGSLAEYSNALNTVIAMAKTEIAKSHRDNHVTIQVPIMPEIQLKHTVKTTAGIIQAQGKVSSIHHVLNIGTRASETSIRFSLSKSVGSQADSVLNIPIATAPLVGDTYNGVMQMYTHKLAVGGFILGPNSRPVKELGMITPAIDDESRSRQETTKSYSANVSVRNDLLNVVY